MNVRCYVDSCCYNCDGECDLEEITISDHELTASGFQPICQDYDEGICQDHEEENEDKENGSQTM